MTHTEVITRITPERAQQCEDAINHHMDNTRALLIELYEGEAWAVRGFANWREYAAARFSHHVSYLYRQLNAGLLERELSPIGELGMIPESQLREVGKLDDPALRQAAWQAAQSQEKVTAQIVKQAVQAAADWANEYIVTQGHTTLGGNSLEVAKTAITERMLETRKRQEQHIATSVERKAGIDHDTTTKYTGTANVKGIMKPAHLLILKVPDDLLNSVRKGQDVTYAVYVTIQGEKTNGTK